MNNYIVNRGILKEAVMKATPWLKERPGNVGRNTNNQKESIPSFAFLGEPGCGKTEFAKRFAYNVLGAKNFVQTTGSAMKSGYVGQTSSLVVAKLKDLVEALGPSDVAILFIDEAYNLFGNDKDGFSAEAVEVLLKALEPGIRTLTAPNPRYKPNSNEPKDLTVTLNGNVAVWLGGYEEKMRKALSTNQGVYRRVVPIVFPTPSADDLLDMFMGDDRLFNPGIFDASLTVNGYELLKRRVISYFRWAKSKCYSEFFGNYAGVDRLVGALREWHMYWNGAMVDENALSSIIEKQKKEIREQYKQVIRISYGRLPFEVSTEIDESFSDYIGSKGTIEKMDQIVTMICEPDKYRDCEMYKGALMVGKPGTGKTFLARCMAGELLKRLKQVNPDKDVAFIKVAATELLNEVFVKGLFSEAASYSNAVIFIDEIDAIAGNRLTQSNNGVLMQLLNEMDGFEGGNNVFVLAATNNPEGLDRAIKRPGRFDLTIKMGLPGKETRKPLLDRYLRLGHKVTDMDGLSDLLKGCTPAEIKAYLNEALILYKRCEDKLQVPNNVDMESWFAHRKVLNSASEITGVDVREINGGEKVYVSSDPDIDVVNEALFAMDLKEVITQKSLGERTKVGELKEKLEFDKNDGGLPSIAVHEVGHALMCVLNDVDFERITILERGNILGFVERSSMKFPTKKDLMNQTKVALAGRIAESIIYGEENVSCGSSNDLMQAASIARDMVAKYGFCNGIGPIALIESSVSYLGRQEEYTCSETYKAKVDEEVISLVNKCYAQAYEALNSEIGKEKIKILAGIVLNEEEMSGEKFEEMVETVKNVNFI